jgi:hypothetical protein
MPTPNRFQVTILSDVADEIRQMANHAKTIGLGISFSEDLAVVNKRLSTDPSDWGDPMFDHHQLRMTRYRGRCTFLYVHFSIHESNRQVFVQGVEINPHGPLR